MTSFSSWGCGKLRLMRRNLIMKRWRLLLRTDLHPGQLHRWLSPDKDNSATSGRKRRSSIVFRFFHFSAAFNGLLAVLLAGVILMPAVPPPPISKPLKGGSTSVVTATVIDFEDLPVGTFVTSQYRSRGVTFAAGTILEPSRGTRSGKQALGNVWLNSESLESITQGSPPLQSFFGLPQSRVKVYVGLDSSTSDATVTLKAFDTANRLLQSTNVTIGGPSAVTIPLEIRRSGSDIKSCEVDFNGQFGYIDDLEFEGTARDQQPPVVSISSPVNDSRVTSALVTLQGAIREDIDLKDVRVIIAGPGGSSREFPILDTLVRGTAPQFTIGPNLVGKLFEGSNKITVRATDFSDNMGEASVFVQLQRPDLFGMAIEVTQAIQDLNNSVPLVAGKSTYVRFHVRATGPSDVPSVSATLIGYRGSTKLGELSSLNPSSQITVKRAPDRGQINDSFLFSLPNSWTTDGWLTLHAWIDPGNAVEESDETNNRLSVTVLFSPVPPLRLKVYGVQYSHEGRTVEPNYVDLDNLASWLVRAYPIPDLYMGYARVRFSFIPSCTTLNGWLWVTRGLDVLFGGEDSRTRYYGMVRDDGGFMRGCAAGIPGIVASGPTGATMYAWDTDGSYGDWYGGHELGHTLGREHANFCGATGGGPYPYPEGRISSADNAFYGFDSQFRRIYPPTWRDVMTYCNNQWISDFTYRGIRNKLLDDYSSLATTTSQPQRRNLIMIEGRVNLDRPSATLGRIYVLRERPQPPLPLPGDYSILFMDRSGNLLMEFPFSPIPDVIESHLPSQLSFDQVVEPPPDRMATIFEILPFDERVARIAVSYKGVELVSRSVSANPPEVKILSPNGGEVLQESATVAWTMSDKDGDPLTGSLLYSADAGTTWITVAAAIEGLSHEVDLTGLPGGDHSLFRILVSDGVNTAEDTSDNTFRVPNKRPTVKIVNPIEGAFFNPGQMVRFQANGQDLEDERLDDEAFSWSSSLQGALGKGRVLEAANLKVGKHAITVEVRDKSGNVGADHINIEVTPTVPVNDRCDFARPIEGTSFTEDLDTTGATSGPEDPVHSCTNRRDNNSVWYSFTPTRDGTVTLRTSDGTFRAVISVYTGACTSLTEVACFASRSTTARLIFGVKAGITYLIQVTSSTPGGGQLQLSFSFR